MENPSNRESLAVSPFTPVEGFPAIADYLRERRQHPAEAPHR